MASISFAASSSSALSRPSLPLPHFQLRPIIPRYSRLILRHALSSPIPKLLVDRRTPETSNEPLYSNKLNYAAYSGQQPVITAAQTDHHVKLQVEEFYLPELPCSFPSQCHPDYEYIKKETNSWLLDWIRPATDNQKELIIETEFAYMICHMIPNSLYRKRMLYLTQFTAWFTSFDDAQEDTTETNSTDLKECIKNAMEGRSTDQQLQRRDIQALDSVLTNFRSIMTPRMHRRHLDALRNFMMGVEKQNAVQQRNIVPDIDSYISNRRQTFAFEHLQVMTEFCLGVELEDDVLQMKSIKELHAAAADYVAWSNDVISFRTEYFRGDFNNLPSIFYFHYNGKIDFQKAMYEACDMIRSREEDIRGLLEEISSSHIASRNPGLQLYLNNLPYLLSGQIQWFYRSAKYHGLGHTNRDRREGWLQMNPHCTILTPVQQHCR